MPHQLFLGVRSHRRRLNHRRFRIIYNCSAACSAACSGSAAASAAVGSMVMSIITVKILAIILLFIMFLSNIAIVCRFNFFTDTASSRGRSSASSSFRRPRPDGRSHGCSWPPVRRGSASRTACCPATLPCCPAGRFCLRHTAEHAVDHRHSLSAGDAGVGVECAVRIARNPAERRRSLDLVFRPVTGMSEKLPLFSTGLVLKRAQIAANSARVIEASGSKLSARRPLTIPSFAIVETALLCHWPSVTSANIFSVVKLPSRTSFLSRRKKIVATTALVMLASGRIVPSVKPMR